MGCRIGGCGVALWVGVCFLMARLLANEAEACVNCYRQMGRWRGGREQGGGVTSEVDSARVAGSTVSVRSTIPFDMTKVPSSGWAKVAGTSQPHQRGRVTMALACFRFDGLQGHRQQQKRGEARGMSGSDGQADSGRRVQHPPGGGNPRYPRYQPCLYLEDQSGDAATQKEEGRRWGRPVCGQALHRHPQGAPPHPPPFLSPTQPFLWLFVFPAGAEYLNHPLLTPTPVPVGAHVISA